MHAVARAEADRAAGRLWKARDRLHGAFVTAPDDQEVLELLGTVLFTMGDLPEAARYWVMTSRTGAELDASFEALLDRHGHRPVAVASAIPVRTDLEALPLVAQERLRGLQAAAEAASGGTVDLGWRPQSSEPVPARPRTWGETAADAFGALFLFVVVCGIVISLGALAVDGITTVFSLFE